MTGTTQRRPKIRRSSPQTAKKKRSQQRQVSALKVFVTDAERELLQTRAAGFNSVSNYIRHHLGLNLNETGRKKKIVVAAFSVAEWDLGEEIVPPAPSPAPVSVSAAGPAEAVPATAVAVSPSPLPVSRMPSHVSSVAFYQPALFASEDGSSDG